MDTAQWLVNQLWPSMVRPRCEQGRGRRDSRPCTALGPREDLGQVCVWPPVPKSSLASSLSLCTATSLRKPSQTYPTTGMGGCPDPCPYSLRPRTPGQRRPGPVTGSSVPQLAEGQHTASAQSQEWWSAGGAGEAQGRGMPGLGWGREASRSRCGPRSRQHSPWVWLNPAR